MVPKTGIPSLATSTQVARLVLGALSNSDLNQYEEKPTP